MCHLSLISGNKICIMTRRKLSSEYNLQVVNPLLAKEWHPTKNGNLTPRAVTPRSQKNVWWKCEKGHEYTRSVGNKSNGDICPYCKGKRAAKDNCLATLNPKLAKEWHPAKNGKLTAEDVTLWSNKKVWWKCKKGHEWQAVVSSRSSGHGCPYCAGQRVTKETSLAAKNPPLAKEWHPTKNGSLASDGVMFGSNKKVWWKCKKGHQWQASVKSRSHGKGCPYCSGQRIHEDNCLATLNPKMAKEWHPTKNGKLTPADVTLGTGKKVWWQCKKGHEWEATLNSRSRGTGCPYCNSQTSVMELRIYTELKYIFDNTRFREKIDKVECDIYIPLLKVGVEYDGEYWHRKRHEKDLAKNTFLEKKGIKLIRVRELGLEKTRDNDIIYEPRKKKEKQLVDRLIKKIEELSILSAVTHERVGQYLKRTKLANNKEFLDLLDMLPSPFPGTALADRIPQLTKEWHPSKNGKLTPKDVGPGSKKIVWWQCEKGHEWKATPGHRFNGTACPYCRGKRACKDNCLATLKPELASEWHPSKNGSLTPGYVTLGSTKKVWWLCKKGHEWEVSVGSRINGQGCPYCSGKRACKDNCLATLKPELASEWHPSKNGSLTPEDVTLGSGKKVWWRCRKGHEWQAVIASRVNGVGCAYCSGRRANKENCLATLNPKLASEWHPTKNGSLTPEYITLGSEKKVWWLCKKGHEWQAIVYNRKKGRGCPYCGGKKVNKDNCLATLRPELASEWHPIKNGILTPANVTLGSNKKVWWKCKKGHEWQAVVASRRNGVGCPYCSGRYATKESSLAFKNPKLAKEWYPVRNGSLTPETITPGSNKKVWWKCKSGHEWESTVKNRSHGRGCPHCKDQ